MMEPAILLAKKPQNLDMPDKEETLSGHTMAVTSSVETLLEIMTPSLADTFQFSKVEITLIRLALVRSALLHDLGKANDQFQKLVRGAFFQKQALRHEWISAWLPLSCGEFATWFFSGCNSHQEVVKDIVIAAVLGHHLKAGDGASIDVRKESGFDQLTCYWAHDDFVENLRYMGELLEIKAEVPEFGTKRIDLLDTPLKELRKWLLKPSRQEANLLIPVAKTLLMAADIAGSALPVKRKSIQRWIRETLERKCGQEDIKGIVRMRLGEHSPRSFQRNVENVEKRIALVRAGCGSGKSIAAYMWAAERAAGRKLFFCYPTTGTATEGYRDYLMPSDLRCDSALLHSRSEVDIENVLMVDDEFEYIDSGLGIAALVSWDVPLVVCTADTVLGIIQNSRRSLYSSPALMNAAFIFDEIHQYDERLYGALLRFLKVFKGVPVLLMTASLPSGRLKKLENDLKDDFVVIEGPPEHEELPRYHLLRPLKEMPWDKMSRILEKGGKVLWVSNTVKRCMMSGFQAEAMYGKVDILPYHSRYCYLDRLKRHNEVIDAFRRNEPIIAVTTQVCEVSLDISADLLVTDLAPIPALIQRLGRLNRRASSVHPGTPCEAVVLEPDSAAPYQDSALQLARVWLNKLSGRSVSQRDLAMQFEIVSGTRQEELSIKSAWLDSGKLTKQAPLRESGFSIPVIREEDEGKIRNQGVSTRKVIEKEIPMLLSEVSREFQYWRKLRHAWVAPTGRVVYDDKWGARWAKR